MRELETDLFQPRTQAGQISTYVHSSPVLGFRVGIARTPNEVLALEDEIGDLLRRAGQPDDLTRTPEYFLAQIRAKKARPYVVTVYDIGRNLIGIVYGARRCLGGVPLGIVECGDWHGDGSILALKEYFSAVVDIAIGQILDERLVRVARVSWNSAASGGADGALRVHQAGTVTASTFQREVWHDLRLEDSYERFLEMLGRQTRRNMRYYRRSAEREGWSYEANIPSEEASFAIEQLYPQQNVGQKDRA
jgi:hypothetical protein